MSTPLGTESPRAHAVIAGTGRAGTTFLVEFLGACGLDVGAALEDDRRFERARAGRETALDSSDGGAGGVTEPPVAVMVARWCALAGLQTQLRRQAMPVSAFPRDLPTPPTAAGHDAVDELGPAHRPAERLCRGIKRDGVWPLGGFGLPRLLRIRGQDERVTRLQVIPQARERCRRDRPPKGRRR